MQKNAVSLVISGKKTIHFADKTVNIKDDEIHFLSAGNCLASMNVSPEQIFRSILIFFDDRILADFHLKHRAGIEAIQSRNKIVSHPYLLFKKDPFILNFIESLRLLLQSGVQLSTEMKCLKFEELMLYLLEKAPVNLLSFQMNPNKDFNDFEIRKAVETNLVNDISLEELAFLCNISLSTFKRRFVKIYGTSPSKWFFQKRMELAKTLLLHHHERPSEVYHKLGYANHSSFSQSFKQTYGITPKAFQLQHLTFQP